jgi:glutaredoxin 3
MSPEITMYSSAWCPFCIQAKRLFDSKGIPYKEIMVDGDAKMRAKMMQESGRHTVPQIWIDDFHVGGCDDLFLLERSAKLDSMINPPNI